MKAIQAIEFGSPNVLHVVNLPDPTPGPGQIAIDVTHAAVGLIDVLFLLVVVWMTDIGAYAVGRLAGGPKLAPAISPGKTVSGAVGGLVIGVAAGLLVARSPAAILPGAIISIVSQAGDLAESALKRRLGVKDSGRTIPGHGGLFDRLDGVLAAAPVAAVLALLAQGGVPLWR